MIKTQFTSLLLAATVSAQGFFGGGNFPSCANTCFSNVVSSFNNADFKALCNNATALSTFQSCLGGTSCSADDKATIQTYINSACGTSISLTGAAPQTTTFSSIWPSGSGYPFGGGFPFGNGPGGWGPKSGEPFGGAGWGPFGSSGPWTSGAWTSWWDGSACPDSTWTGWTSGAWGTNAPWTSWTACTATTTATSIYETTIGGSATTVTSVAFNVEQATATATGSGFATTGAAAGGRQGALEGAIGAGVAAFVGAVIAL